MFYSADAGRGRFWRVGIARNVVYHSFVAPKAQKRSAPKSEVVRRIGCLRLRQNLRCAVARERFGSQNRKKWQDRSAIRKFSSAKFAPLRRGARGFLKSKTLKTDSFGGFWTFQMFFAWEAQGFWQVAKYVAGAGVHEGCKNAGRRGGGFEKGPKRCFSRGRRKDFWLCGIDAWSVGRWNRGRAATCGFQKIVTSQGSFRVAVTGVRMPYSWQAQYFWSVGFKIAKSHCNFEVKCLVDNVVIEGSLAEKLRFQASRLHLCLWRKSCKKASFSSFGAPSLKEVSQKSFDFWVSQLRFWRKSRRKASFSSFEALLWRRSLAEKLRFQAFWHQLTISSQWNLRSVKSHTS